MALQIVRSIAELRTVAAEARRNGLTTCVVPTMGGLHDGHLSLIKRAAEIADFVIVTLFVNPTQFNNPGDLASYPRDEKMDLASLEKTAADSVYIPNCEEMYPAGFATIVAVDSASGVLCDAYRPGHFDGVTTVVAKLFIQTGAEFACFGEKDYQQLFLVTQMARDLDLPIEVVPVPTVREKDGLALSSRNRRLSPGARKLAPALHAAMCEVAKSLRAGSGSAKECASAVKRLQNDGAFRVEYFEVRSTKTLELTENIDGSVRLFAAAWLDGVRLIDNVEI